MREPFVCTLKGVRVHLIEDPYNPAKQLSLTSVTIESLGLDPELARRLSRCALHGHRLDITITCAQDELPLGLDATTGELVAR